MLCLWQRVCARRAQDCLVILQMRNGTSGAHPPHHIWHTLRCLHVRLSQVEHSARWLGPAS